MLDLVVHPLILYEKVFNYKKLFSITLQGLLDANYKFIIQTPFVTLSNEEYFQKKKKGMSN